MAHFELHTHSAAACCVCDRALSRQEFQEVSGMLDESLYGEVYCGDCLGEQLLLCRECSGRYTLNGMCGECMAKEYGMVG